MQKCETAVSYIDYDKQGTFFARIKETEKYSSDENAECTVVSSTLPEIGRTTFCGLPRRWKEEESISQSLPGESSVMETCRWYCISI